jgi:hypothetical protein
MIRKLWTIILFAWVITACQPTLVYQTPTIEPVQIIKRLATIAPTLTPNVAEISEQQTAIASQATPIPTLTPQPTLYIGVFLGETSQDPFAPVLSISGASQIVQENNPTAFPSGIRIICDIPEDSIFGLGWRDNTQLVNELRCPIQIMFGFTGRIQVFEGGAMYYRPETGETWAISPASTGDSGQYWYLGQPPPLENVGISDIPAGRLAPASEFASMWLAIPELRQALGFAVQQAVNSDINVQRFDGGSLFLDANSGLSFVLLLNGDAIGPYQGNITLP